VRGLSVKLTVDKLYVVYDSRTSSVLVTV